MINLQRALLMAALALVGYSAGATFTDSDAGMFIFGYGTLALTALATIRL